MYCKNIDRTKLDEYSIFAVQLRAIRVIAWTTPVVLKWRQAHSLVVASQPRKRPQGQDASLMATALVHRVGIRLSSTTTAALAVSWAMAL